MISYSILQTLILVVGIGFLKDHGIYAQRTMSRPFRLRMYWERGYMWQEDPRPREFCIQCTNGCREGDLLHTRMCRNRRYTQYFVKIGSTLRPLLNRNLCVARSGNRKITLRVCDDHSDDQIWYGLRFDGGRFELTDEEVNPSKCLSQHHHPKPREILYMESCALARDFDTSYWITE
jgi:Ricin-type beta-trefoil lectin domain.